LVAWVLGFCLAAVVPAGAAAHSIPNVPFFPDSKNQCGPAVLAGVLNFWGVAADPEELRKEVYIDRLKGSLAIDLAVAARARGLKAEMVSASTELLKKEISAGRPVIAFLNLGFSAAPIGHFVLVTGFDDEKEGFYAHSGGKDKFFPYKRFLKNWKKTGYSAILVAPNEKA
jgi:ABC-type bacteriocin/lantibiotic exporter with double-glycine peptidase domain